MLRSIVIYVVLIIGSATLLCGCMERYDTSYEPKLVVEGWIENDERPIVILTQLIPPNMVFDTMTIASVVVRWGKVTISDGVNSEIMVGRRDTNYLMQFYYTTLRMRGEIGKTYSIVAEYGDVEVRATTTIPEPVEISSIKMSSVSGVDTSFILNIKIDDPVDEDNYYMVSSRIRGESDVFKPTMIGVWSDEKLDGEIPVYRYLEILRGAKPNLYYNLNDTVEIKLEHIDRVAYNYWSDFMGNFLSNGNPIFPFYSNVLSNIDDGLGVWYGLGGSKYEVLIVP